MGLFKKLAALVIGDPGVSSDFRMPKTRSIKRYTERELLQLESEIGSQLFGDIPAGHRREFFCLDENTWIWYEEWIDQTTKKRERMTTRYEVNEKGILKVLEGARYSYLDGAELKNFAMATKLYYERVAREIYKRDPQTGKSLA